MLLHDYPPVDAPQHAHRSLCAGAIKSILVYLVFASIPDSIWRMDLSLRPG
jgi:hypothetical protein